MDFEGKKSPPGSQAEPESTRREFCRKSGLLVLGTAAYTVISILGGPKDVQAGACGCPVICNCSCTSVRTPTPNCGVRG